MKRLLDFFRGKQAPSAPPAPSAPVLRNVPGGMAWVRGLVGDEAPLNGRAVKTVRFVNGLWQIEPEQRVVLSGWTRDGFGRIYPPGGAIVTGMVDEYLEPWKDTGLTDEEVRGLYSKQPHPAHDQLAPSRPKVLG